MLPSYR
jgi:hypothetical protein